MVEERDGPVIIAKVAGRQRRLVTSKQWRAAITGLEISRETEVLYDNGKGQQVALPAEECPELAAIFDELIGPKQVMSPPPARALAPPPPSSPPPPPSSPPPLSAKEFEVLESSKGATPQLVYASPEVQHSGSSVSPVAIVTLAIAMLLAIFVFIWGSDRYGDEDAQTVTVYVSGRANVRDQPSAEGSIILDTYNAGTQLSGSWVSGVSDVKERWLEFEADGQNRYIWDGNLSVAASPVQAETNKFSGSIDPDEAKKFINSYVDSTNSSSGMSTEEVVNSYYNDKVRYFGKNVVRSYVSDEKVRYTRRWPERNYKIIENTLNSDCASIPEVCSVSGTMWYDAKSEERGAHGEGYAEFTLAVKTTSSGLKIVSENSRVISN